MIVPVNPPMRYRASPPKKASRTKTFTKADVAGAVDALQSLGLGIAEIQLSIDGSAIRVVTTNGRSSGGEDLFSRWEHRL